MTHESVLLAEAIAWLEPGPGKVLVDGTLGRGGHAKRWLDSALPDGQVVGFDRDPQAVLETRRLLEGYGDRAVILQGNFKDCPTALRERGFGAVDAILLDLGVSSPQLDEAQRGFSFSQDGPLDMRMDPDDALSAADIVNESTEKELSDLFWAYGEERFSRQIAKRIVQERAKKKIMRTRELENVIFHAVPRAARYGRIHPATRCFQALRLRVNAELEALGDFLPEAPALLKRGGRMAVISFHSLEDRIVKNSFKDLEKKGLLKILTKKPIEATDAETSQNPRSRSAKMRVAVKAEEAR